MSDVIGFIAVALANALTALALIVGEATAGAEPAWLLAGSGLVNAGAFVLVARGFLSGSIVHRSSSDAERRLTDIAEASHRRESDYHQIITHSKHWK